MKTYKIVRFYQDESIDNEVIKTGLTLEEAKAHCADPESDSKTAKSSVAVVATARLGAWFDGWREEPGPAENTEYVRKWILEDDHPDIYNKAVELAEGGDTDKLREFVITTLRAARQGPAHDVSSNMSDADLDMVDWSELRDDLANH
jgi:hypothetical protein